MSDGYIIDISQASDNEESNANNDERMIASQESEWSTLSYDEEINASQQQQSDAYDSDAVAVSTENSDEDCVIIGTTLSAPQPNRATSPSSVANSENNDKSDESSVLCELQSSNNANTAQIAVNNEENPLAEVAAEGYSGQDMSNPMEEDEKADEEEQNVAKSVFSEDLIDLTGGDSPVTNRPRSFDSYQQNTNKVNNSVQSSTNSSSNSDSNAAAPSKTWYNPFALPNQVAGSIIRTSGLSSKSSNQSHRDARNPEQYRDPLKSSYVSSISRNAAPNATAPTLQPISAAMDLSALDTYKFSPTSALSNSNNNNSKPLPTFKDSAASSNSRSAAARPAYLNAYVEDLLNKVEKEKQKYGSHNSPSTSPQQRFRTIPKFLGQISAESGNRGSFAAAAKKKSNLVGKHPLMRERMREKGISGGEKQDEDTAVEGAVKRYKRNIDRLDNEEHSDYHHSDYGYNSTPATNNNSANFNSVFSRNSGSLNRPKAYFAPPPPELPKSHLKTVLLDNPAHQKLLERKKMANFERESAKKEQKRLKASLDDLHKAILGWNYHLLDSSVRLELHSALSSMKIRFKDELEYQEILYPLLLEECRASIVAQLEETKQNHRERMEKQLILAREKHISTGNSSQFDYSGLLELVTVQNFTQINDFTDIDVARVETTKSAANRAASLFSDSDLVLLWWRSNLSSAVEIVNSEGKSAENQANSGKTKQKLSVKLNEWDAAEYSCFAYFSRLRESQESHEPKQDKGHFSVKYRLRVHFEGNSSRTKRLKQLLLREGAEWGCLSAFSLKTVQREYRALQSAAVLEIFPLLLNPKFDSTGLNSAGVDNLSIFPAHLLANYNESQRSAINTALSSHHGFTLIQGPPGTGKTKTLIGLIQLLILQQSALAAGKSGHRPRLLVCAPSNAAIDEIVTRLLEIQQQSGSVRFELVRVGAGARDKLNERENKALSSAVDIDSVSLDRLLEQKAVKSENSADSELQQAELQQYHTAIARSNQEISRITSELAELKQLQNEEALNEFAALNSSQENNLEAVEEAQKAKDKHTEKERQLKGQLTELHGHKKAQLSALTAAQSRGKQAKLADQTKREGLLLSILDSANIVCTTLSGAGMDIFTKSHKAFETVIIDEAAQALELSALIPLKYHAQRCILVGDPQQLPATVISQAAVKFDYKQSLFQRLQLCGHSVEMLTIQYRMHSEIRSFPSQHFYENKLIDAKQLIQSPVFTHHPAINGDSVRNDNSIFSKASVDIRLGPYVVFDVKEGAESRQNSSSLHNSAEAKLCAELILFLRRQIKLHSRGDFSDLQFCARIGVISPYRQQVREIKKELARISRGAKIALSSVEVNTVDGFQGREKDFILFSCVRARPNYQVNSHNGSAIGFVSDAARLNVALTRAKYGLYLLGNLQTLQHDSMWSALITNARQRDLVVEVDKNSEQIFHPELHQEPRFIRKIQIPTEKLVATQIANVERQLKREQKHYAAASDKESQKNNVAFPDNAEKITQVKVIPVLASANDRRKRKAEEKPDKAISSNKPVALISQNAANKSKIEQPAATNIKAHVTQQSKAAGEQRLAPVQGRTSFPAPRAKPSAANRDEIALPINNSKTSSAALAAIRSKPVNNNNDRSNNNNTNNNRGANKNLGTLAKKMSLDALLSTHGHRLSK
jgi:superfamily I DNA and/or RNA helicase